MRRTTSSLALLVLAALILATVALPAVAQPAPPRSLTAPDYRKSLIQFEGVRLKPCREANGDWTVGIGHNLSANREPVKPLYTQNEIALFFDRDLAAALRAARSLVTDFDDLPDPAKEVVVHLIFQCGPTGFSRFKNLRFALSRRAFNAATAELWDSRWFRQTPAPRANWSLRSLQSL